MADNDKPNKFVSEEGEMLFLSVEEINALKLATVVSEDDEGDEGDDELDLDEIDEEDLQDLADEEE